MHRALAALIAAFALPALAGEPTPPDAPTATAVSTSDQIDAYLRASPVLSLTPDASLDDAPARPIDRKPHGEVEVGIGTGGYRSLYASTILPVGEAGWLSLAFENSHNDRAFGWSAPYDDGRLGPAKLPGPFLDRQRCGLETMTPARALDPRGGPNGRCSGVSRQR